MENQNSFIVVRSCSGFSSAGSPPPWPYAGSRQWKNGEAFLPSIYHSRATGGFSLPVTVGNVTAESRFRLRCVPLRRPENLHCLLPAGPYVWAVGSRRSSLSRSNLSFRRIYEVRRILSFPLHPLQRRHTRKKGSGRFGEEGGRCGSALRRKTAIRRTSKNGLRWLSTRITKRVSRSRPVSRIGRRRKIDACVPGT